MKSDDLYTRKFFDLWRKDESDRFTRRLAFFCACRSGRFAETLCNLVSANDVYGLCTFSIDYHFSDTVRELAYARQTLAFYSKDADIELIDTDRAMFMSFAETELQCRSTNSRISTLFQSGELFTCADGVFYDVQRKIIEIMGDVPTFDELDIGFGPGQNVGLKSKSSTPRHKLDAVPTCSASMLTLIKEFALSVPAYFASHKCEVQVVSGRLAAVAKNALTKRSIIIEPILNGLAQKGIGSYFKTRLLAFGCNLKSQRKNQMLARKGSIDGSVVTVDVKNASNTLALLIAYHSMSEKWFNLLDCLRTSTVTYKDKLIELEMFSSMGNGFTFELESIIFYAIAITVCTRMGEDTSLVSVYGDDIIVPVDCYKALLETLSLFGFVVNKSKTFSEGPFRESCGVDYFLGVNIRPFYKKDRWTNARLTGLLNQDLSKLGLFADVRLELEILLMKSGVSFGPSQIADDKGEMQGTGDGHLHYSDLDPDCERHLHRVLRTVKQQYKLGSVDGSSFNAFIKVPNKDDSKCDIGDTLAPFYDIYAKPSLRAIVKMARFTGLIYDVYGMGHLSPKEEFVAEYFIDVSDGISSHESDPYIVRDGWKSKVIKIYTLSHPFTERYVPESKPYTGLIPQPF